MGKAEWSVTVSDELNDAVMAYLAKSGQGVEGLSNLVENAVANMFRIRALWTKKVTLLKVNSMISSTLPFSAPRKSIPA